MSPMLTHSGDLVQLEPRQRREHSHALPLRLTVANSTGRDCEQN